MSIPHKCPVCQGCGRVSIPMGVNTSSAMYPTAQCHACSGTGVIWENTVGFQTNAKLPGVVGPDGMPVPNQS